MSIARHHAEWLSLLDISGPFLSLPALLRVFPQGLDAHEPEVLRELRLGYERWLDEQQKSRPDPALHRAWVQLVLQRGLGLEKEYLAEGQAIPESLKWVAPQYGETFRPDFVLTAREDAKPSLLIFVFPPQQRLDRSPIGSRLQDPLTTRLMEILRATGASLSLATNGEEWMLVTSPDISGGTTGYISWYAHLWLEEHITLRAFRSLLGLRRFFGVSDDETLEAMVRESATDQYELTDQLGAQVRHAVEVLVQAIDRTNQERKGTLLVGVSETELYEAALTVMMRLVFLFAAEERRLFPLDDAFYADNYAVSTLRANLREVGDQYGEELLERRYDAWCRLLATFRAVYGGVQHDRLNLLAYGGSLFDPERFPFLEGRAKQAEGRENGAEPLPINNRVVLYILEALQILRVRLPRGGGAEARRLSFRALDIEQIGDIYQTLLDHTAQRATAPVLGLVGTKKQEPEIALTELEAMHAKGRDTLVEFLQEETGRSENALKRAINGELVPDALTLARLRTMCGNDELFRHVRPFANLIRNDDFGNPVVILPGSVYVTQGMTRRQTQSHYTPRSLTEPLVQHTLEPLVYIGPAEGLPQEQWNLKSAGELLQLKVCDMAMGSASILVQVVRYLGDRLVEAWAEIERGQRTDGAQSADDSGRSSVIFPRITPEGKLATGAPGEELIPLNPDERQLFARRIVAARCIYGVDKNPLAVELAKLSLWLVTLDKNRPFTFLNHALKCGDSLVGADEDMFLRWTHSDQTSTMPLFDEQLRAQLDTARAKRRELETFDVRDPRDTERKQYLLDQANGALENIKLGCDIVVGTHMLKLKDKEREPLLNRALLDFVAGKPLEDQGTLHVYDAARQARAFHWFAEFPEVFEHGGFDAFVGNPPFLGGQKISGTLGEKYLDYLKETWPHARGSADLCAYFFLRAFENVQPGGTFGLLGTNTIAQGDTRELGLEYIVKQGGVIYRARPSVPWPGMAAVYVGIVHIANGRFEGLKWLDDSKVASISPLLDTALVTGSPARLIQNAGQSFMGSTILGKGFLVPPERAQELVLKDSRNAQVLFPYLNGEDMNSYPEQSASRWVINFFDWPLEKAREFPECFRIVAERVKPEREQNTYSKTAKERWWQYERPRPELYETISRMNRVLVIALTSRTAAFAFVPKGIVYAHALGVFAFEDAAHFALLQSGFHIEWAWKYGSSLKGDLRYTPSDIFETFPFPLEFRKLELIGETYHEHRRQLMLARQEGLTTTYNRFHNAKERSADIQRLRDLHVEMDNAVAAAYGWTDLELAHGFHETAQGIRFTISDEARREVLARLLRLNHERYEAEVRMGLHDKGKKRERAAERDQERNKGKRKQGDRETGRQGNRGKKRSGREQESEYNARLFE